MKSISFIRLLCLLFFNQLLYAVNVASFSGAPEQGPLLVVVIMVKDEEQVIRQTLQMYCAADPLGQYIGYYVYDTGPDSWSPTMEKAQELFKEYHVPYAIAQEPFVDFATSRNKGLRAAEKHFPHATFMLMPDAEWYINDVSSLIQFCQIHAHEEHITSYMMRIISTSLDFYTPRLIRAHKNICFEGVVHEVIKSNEKGTMMGPQGVHFEYPEQPAGLKKSQQRWYRDRDMLLKEYIRNPLDPRNTFYLAQTYDCLNEFENAYYYYVKRTQLTGFVEEDYMAHYRLGVLSERMQLQNMNYDWTCALRHYLDAFMLRPNRAEPLVRIAAYYINRNMHNLAFLYAYMACQIPYPTDVLFLEKELYERVRYEIFTKSALKVELEIPERVCKEACKVHEHTVPLEKFILSQSFAMQ